ncbi:MAG: uracil-DNA glycosylase [Negativicutes bacterium]|nr:uracil-DNA glycosylase [Negativicutes bacterium]
MEKSGKPIRPACMDCTHHYVTWDKVFPFGCRAMGFKSKAVPHLLTQQLSGEVCLSFVPKKNLKRDK